MSTCSSTACSSGASGALASRPVRRQTPYRALGPRYLLPSPLGPFPRRFDDLPQTGLEDFAGEPLRVREGLLVDAVATLGAGLLGTSSGTAYIESAAGVEAG